MGQPVAKCKSAMRFRSVELLKEVRFFGLIEQGNKKTKKEKKDLHEEELK